MKQHRQCVTTVTCRSVAINSAPYLLVLVLYHITRFSALRPEGSNPPRFYMTGRNDENEWPFRSCSAVSRLSRTRHPQNDLLRIRTVFILKSVTFNGGRNGLLILTTKGGRGGEREREDWIEENCLKTNQWKQHCRYCRMARRWAVWVKLPAGRADFSVLKNSEANCWAHAPFCSKDTVRSFSGSETAGAWGSPLTST